MFEALGTLFQEATRARLLLLLNHVLASEPVGTERLKPWEGRTIAVSLDDLPAPLRLLHLQPTWVLQITSAGLLDQLPASGLPADLQIHIDASNPLLMAIKAAGGERPDVRIDGDAALAADMGWLIQNLRWDIEDDLSKLLGPAMAHQVGQIGRAVAAALARLASGLASIAPAPR